MNFAGPRRRGGVEQKWFMTDRARSMILNEYDSKNRREIARRLAVPPWIVSKWAGDLGVRRVKEKPWTSEQVAFLERNVSTMGWKRLSRELGRSVCAIKLKAKRLRCGKIVRDGYTAHMLTGLFGVDHRAIERWIGRGWLKARRRRTDRTPAQGGDAYFITDRSLRRFICKHPDEIDLRRVDRFWFIDLAFGSDHAGYGPASTRESEGHGEEEAA